MKKNSSSLVGWRGRRHLRQHHHNNNNNNSICYFDVSSAQRQRYAAAHFVGSFSLSLSFFFSIFFLCMQLHTTAPLPYSHRATNRPQSILRLERLRVTRSLNKNKKARLLRAPCVPYVVRLCICITIKLKGSERTEDWEEERNAIQWSPPSSNTSNANARW